MKLSGVDEASQRKHNVIEIRQAVARKDFEVMATP